jgi:hypothetical protein
MLLVYYQLVLDNENYILTEICVSLEAKFVVLNLTKRTLFDAKFNCCVLILSQYLMKKKVLSSRFQNLQAILFRKRSNFI